MGRRKDKRDGSIGGQEGVGVGNRREVADRGVTGVKGTTSRRQGGEER